jgi:hypothetical protein
MKLKTKKNRPHTTLERQRQVILELQQQRGVAEVQYLQAQHQHVQLQLEQRLLYGCCGALQLLQLQLQPAGHAFDVAGAAAVAATAAAMQCSSLQEQQATLLQQLQQLPLDDVPQPSTPTSSSDPCAQGSFGSDRQDISAALPRLAGTSSSSGLQQQQDQAEPTFVANDFPFVLGQAPESAGCQAGFPPSPASSTLPTPPATAHAATAVPGRSASASTQVQGCPMVLLQYLLSLPPWPAAADMTLQQLSACYCSCVEEAALALHLLQQRGRPRDFAAAPLHRLQCTIVRWEAGPSMRAAAPFAWPLQSSAAMVPMT